MMKNYIAIALTFTSLLLPVANLNAQPVTNPEGPHWLLALEPPEQQPGSGDDRFGGGAGRLYEPPPNVSELPEGFATPQSPRGNCPDEFLALQAVAPSASRGFTAQSRPTFWVYIPSIATNRKATFKLNLVEGDEKIDEFEVSLPSQPGIISLQPKKELIPNVNYRWYLNIPCYPSGDDEISLQGTVRRVDDNEFKLENRWYDLVSEAVSEREWWVELLTKVGLEDLTNQPILN
ncbi:MAG: DUF928 domain-containing protein [Crocosphaera sp.]|nr:DUF928 domain-containing protein [Crocosphaera sp.]